MTGITKVYQVTTPFPLCISAMEGSRHCHHLRLLDKSQLGDLSQKDWMPVPPWMEKTPPNATENMSHEYWLLIHVFRHEHRLENGYGSSLFTDFTIPSKLDGELNTKNRPHFGFSGSQLYLTGPNPRTRGHGTQFLLICLDTFRWAIWMQSGSRAASSNPSPALEAGRALAQNPPKK